MKQVDSKFRKETSLLLESVLCILSWRIRIGIRRDWSWLRATTQWNAHLLDVKYFFYLLQIVVKSGFTSASGWSDDNTRSSCSVYLKCQYRKYSREVSVWKLDFEWGFIINYLFFTLMQETRLDCVLKNNSKSQKEADNDVLKHCQGRCIHKPSIPTYHSYFSWTPSRVQQGLVLLRVYH